MPDESLVTSYLVNYEGEQVDGNEIAANQFIRQDSRRYIDIQKRQLGSFLDDDFHIPEYQRGYQWDEEEWEELWDEIEQLFEPTERTNQLAVTDVFFGSMFFAERAGEETEPDIVYDIIDGQQRITTLTILFNIIWRRMVEAIAAGGQDLVFELGQEHGVVGNVVMREPEQGVSGTPSLTLNQHNNAFFWSLLKGEEYQLRYLVRQKRVHGNTKNNAIKVRKYLNKLDIDHDEYFEALDDEENFEEEYENEPYEPLSDLDGLPNLTDTQLEAWQTNGPDGLTANQRKTLLDNKVTMMETNQRLLRCHEFFAGEISDLFENVEEPRRLAYGLTNLKDFIFNCFHVGYFEVEQDRPTLLMKIFEILNNRGVELKMTDIIRTRVVGYSRRHNDDEFIDIWEGIVSEFDATPSLIIDFLNTYFVIEEPNISARGDIGDHLLEAFALEELDNSQLTSRLSSADDGGESGKAFLTELRTYAEYYHDLIDPFNRGLHLTDEGDSEIEDECNQIISRLENVDVSVWQPIALGLYADIREESPNQKPILREYLQVAESLAVRFYVRNDVKTKDAAYAAAVNEYSNSGLDSEITETLVQSVHSNNNRLFGKQLVSALSQESWDSDWGKQVLRMLATRHLDELDESEEIATLRLNRDNSIVQLEHVFPKSPKQEETDPYQWYRHFFKLQNGGELANVVELYIDEENDDILTEIANEWKDDLGNYVLLPYQENISLGNSLYGTKLAKYDRTRWFEDIRVNNYLVEEHISLLEFDELQRYVELTEALDEISEGTWEQRADELGIDAESQESLAERISNERDSLDDVAERFDSLWTYEAVTEHKGDLIELLCDTIELDPDDGFEIDFQEMVENEQERRNEVLAANYRRL